MTDPTNPVVTSFNTLAPILIQDYESYLPTAFDENLTLLQKVNMIIQNITTSNTTVNNLINEWNTQIVPYVNGDGFQTDVNNKLDAMANDGTLANIINVSMIGTLSNLKTTVNDNLVDAINDNHYYVTEIGGYGVLSGLSVVAQATPNMSVLINSGVIHLENGNRYNISEINSIPITTADPTQSRTDIIYVSGIGVVTYLAGSLGSGVPTTPTDGYKLAEITVGNGVNSITNVNIKDTREIINNNKVLTEQLADIALDIRSFGFVGDGVNDDAVSIQNAVNHVISLIQQKSSGTDVFAGQVTIQLPPNKIYIKSKILVNNAITIEGHGTASTLILNANLDYIFDFNGNDAGCVTKNEENQMEGGGLRKVRISGNKRKYTLTSAVRFYDVDHAVMDSVYFYAIKGKCWELKTCRESNFNNLFTRFCGTTTQGNFETVTPDSGADTSNLNMGTNWNIVFPYGPAINFSQGTFENVDGLLIHGIFNTIYNDLTTYFGTNSDYNTSGQHQIVLTNGSSLNLNNVNFQYTPDLHSAIHLDNSTCYVSNIIAGNHYSANETHGDGNSTFSVANNGNLYLNSGVNVSTGSTNGDIIVNDGTGKVNGSISNRPLSTNVNSDVNNAISANPLVLMSDKSEAATIRPWSDETNSNIAGEGYINYDFRTTKTNDKSMLHLGYRPDQTGANIGMTAIPDNTFLRLPTNVTANMPPLNNLMWIDSGDGSLKVMIGGVVKTVTVT